MANTSNVLTAFAIVLFASLSLSSAFGNLDIHNDFEKHLDHELQPFLREKRQKEAEVRHLRNNIPLELEEELLEPKPVYERTAVYEETEIGERKKQEEQKKLNVDPKISNAIEEEEENIQVTIKICHCIYLSSKQRNESKSKVRFSFRVYFRTLMCKISFKR